jgi:hypothetical protein
LLDEDLDPVENAAVAEHVQGCAACQQQLERMVAAGAESSLVPSRSGRPGPGAAAGALLDRLKQVGTESETLQHGRAGDGSPRAPRLPEVPGYHVLEELGRGGMGAARC